MSNLEDMIEELSGKKTYTIYKRSLPVSTPQTLNKIIAQNIPSYEAGLQFCKTMKLETKEEYDDDGSKRVIFYDILPDTPEYKDLFYNDTKITTVGNNKRTVGQNYFDIGG